jgi:chitin disaccharide deacetylase
VSSLAEHRDGEPDGKHRVGVLIINADDWGRNRETTDRILQVVCHGSVSSVSAMMFMEDSERAAAIAKKQRVDAGLHLNLTTPFSPLRCRRRLIEHQQRIARYLLSSRFSQAVYHPLLRSSFEYVVAAQLDEYRRLYDEEPGRIDGHHHMHLCANVLIGKLLPAGTIARRSFSFARGERSLGNRLYRKAIDGIVAQRHRMADFFFSLPPLERSRLGRILSLATHSSVEVETHPVNKDEYRFLCSKDFVDLLTNIELSSGYHLAERSRPLRLQETGTA